jgi:hypothetical protein
VETLGSPPAKKIGQATTTPDIPPANYLPILAGTMMVVRNPMTLLRCPAKSPHGLVQIAVSTLLPIPTR